MRFAVSVRGLRLDAQLRSVVDVEQSAETPVALPTPLKNLRLSVPPMVRGPLNVLRPPKTLYPAGRAVADAVNVG